MDRSEHLPRYSAQQHKIKEAEKELHKVTKHCDNLQFQLKDVQKQIREKKRQLYQLNGDDIPSDIGETEEDYQRKHDGRIPHRVQRRPHSSDQSPNRRADRYIPPHSRPARTLQSRQRERAFSNETRRRDNSYDQPPPPPGPPPNRDSGFQPFRIFDRRSSNGSNRGSRGDGYFFRSKRGDADRANSWRSDGNENSSSFKPPPPPGRPPNQRRDFSDHVDLTSSPDARGRRDPRNEIDDMLNLVSSASVPAPSAPPAEDVNEDEDESGADQVTTDEEMARMLQEQNDLELAFALQRRDIINDRLPQRAMFESSYSYAFE